MNAITKTENTTMLPALQMNEAELIEVLGTSLYPGAAVNSIKMVLGYCKASGLDPMQKPVHIVPMWDGKAKQMRDVVMPGIGLYRTQAARSNAYGGISEPDFGPDVTETLGNVTLTYPTWCKVTVKRRLPDGSVADFTAIERWKENYATAAKDTTAPNAMWKKRPYGQLSKCAQAQALRMAFPEIGAEATAEEMDGKMLYDDVIDAQPASAVRMPRPRAAAADDVQDAQPNATSQAQAQATPQPTPQTKPIVGGQLKWIEQKCAALGLDVVAVVTQCGAQSLDTLTPEQFDTIKAHLLAQG